MSTSYSNESTCSLSQTWYQSIAKVLESPTLSAHQKYQELFAIFCDVLHEQTKSCQLLHNGTFAKLSDVCHRYNIPPFHINEFRIRFRQLDDYSDQQLVDYLIYDAKSLVEFVAQIYSDTIPDRLQQFLPAAYKSVEYKEFMADCVRMAVSHCDDTYIYGINSETLDELKVILRDDDSYYGNYDYFKQLLKESDNCQINLIRPVEKQGVIYPELIIYEPDYLVDISQIASCFDVYANSPYVSLLNKLQPDKSSSAILLGNFASQMLDEEINLFANPREYRESVRRFYKSNALAIATCPDYNHVTFHEQAKIQQGNLRGMLRGGFQSTGLELDKVILEPSFFCEKLGIQGRMDLLQEDFKVLMEQKSGKWNDFNCNPPMHREPHYVQMLLYLALLHFNFDLKYKDIECYLLYSKYNNGLIRESTAPRLLFEALKIRNQLVWLEYKMLSTGKARQIFEALTPDKLNQKGLYNRLWSNFVYPRLNDTLTTLKRATDLEKSYFYRMYTFLSYEHLLGRIGTPQSPCSGFASLWLNTVQEKLESGSIITDLKLCDIEAVPDEGVSTLKLQASTEKEGMMPNFRVSDIVVLYSYNAQTTPDVRQSIAYRCTIKKITQQTVIVQLHAPQQNRHQFEDTTLLWAVEHDYMEASSTSLFRQLMLFLQATEYRKGLILNKINPSYDDTKTLVGDYGEFNELVLKSKQANDYFILVGPPGTGKTTKGLVNILKEELLDDKSNVLLLSFTNKAVDEICSKLVHEHIDFVRLGGHISCSPEYHNNLLINRIDEQKNVDEVRQLISNTRVFVATTTTMNRNLQLLNLKKFSMAIVDEASQILEPQLLGVMSLHNDIENLVGKFILIGDHKQLPAVVQQSREESKVVEPELLDIGLVNCAESLFERLYRRNVGDAHIVHVLDKQARMHPSIAAFPSQEFYHGLLKTRNNRYPEPLLNYYDPQNRWHVLLKNNRLAFIDVFATSTYLATKVNTSEAEIIAEMVKSVVELYDMNKIPFKSDQTLGVIVPYRHQIAEIRSLLDGIGKDVVIDTVERFQGGERDIIIYGTTIRNYNQLEFLCSNTIEDRGQLIDRKLNVALTRARHRLVVVGNSNLLKRNVVYRNLLEYIKAHGLYI